MGKMYRPEIFRKGDKSLRIAETENGWMFAGKDMVELCEIAPKSVANYIRGCVSPKNIAKITFNMGERPAICMLALTTGGCDELLKTVDESIADDIYRWLKHEVIVTLDSKLPSVQATKHDTIPASVEVVMPQAAFNVSDLQIVEYKGQRVLTTEQLALAYGCTPRNIRDNFNNNQNRFIEGKHYFRLEGAELKAFKNSTDIIGIVGENANTLYLWTKRGSFRHCKFIGTDNAFNVFDDMEEVYFTAPEFKPITSMTPNELIAAMANQNVEMERRLAAAEAKQEQQTHELQGMRDIISLDTTDWRKRVNSLLNRMAKKQGGGDKYMERKNESYHLLNYRMGVDVGKRLSLARQRMKDAGYSKSKIEALNILDVIEQDRKLVQGYLAIVKEMAIKYGVSLD